MTAIHLNTISGLLLSFSRLVSAYCKSNYQSVSRSLEVLTALDETVSSDEFIDTYIRFHTEIAECIPNLLIREVYVIGLNILASHSGFKTISGTAKARFIQAHKELFKALHNGSTKRIRESLEGCYDFSILLRKEIPFVYESFGTGSPGGSFYSVASRIAKILNAKGSINIHLALTGGGIENIRLAEEGKTILGLTQSDIADAAYKGTGIFKRKYSHLRTICRMLPLDLWIITGGSSSIIDVSDLKGRRIAMGATGGDSSILAKRILQTLGYLPEEYRAYYLPISNAVEGLLDDEIDVVFYLSTGVPPVIEEYQDRFPFKLLSIPEVVLETLEEESTFWKRSNIVSPLFPKEIHTLSVSSILITGSLMPEELVYEITSTLLSDCEYIDAESVKNYAELTIPLHSGALKALRESENV